jgi:hypothetical protein
VKLVRFFIIYSILVLIITACGKDRNQEIQEPPHEINIASVVDVQVTGWKAGSTRVILKKEDLDNYAGNLSNLYYSYGFKTLVAKEYKNPKSISVIVEAFELDNSEDAFGLYSFDTIGKKQDIGQGAVYNHGIMRFWKDRVFVRIIARENYKEVEKDVMNFAKVVEKKISYEGEKPKMLDFIPQENLIPDSLCFFHQNICLNNIYYVPETYSLALSDQTDAVAVQYNVGGSVYPRLVIVKYPDESSAQNAYNGFTVLYFDVNTPVYSDDNINVVRTEEGEYNSISIRRNYIVLVFESRSSNTSRQFADATLKKIGRKN